MACDNMNEMNKAIGIEKVENEIAGVKRGVPMSFEDADGGKTNPYYAPYTATADNCQSYVPVFMARLEGFNIHEKAFDESNAVMDM